MANRKRLDPGVVEQVEGFVEERLREAGNLSPAEVRLIMLMVDRSEQTIGRIIDRVAARIGLKLTKATHALLPDLPAIEAFLNGQPFTFACDDMRRLALAYCGNLSALHKDAVKMATALGLAGPVGYVQLTRKYNDELDSDERAKIRHGIAGWKAASLYRRWSARYRNAVWQIDATKLDLWVRISGSETVVRPDLLVVVDDFSRVILAACLMLHDYSAEDAAACMYRAMRLRDVTLPDGRVVQVGGRPGTTLCDNALQFTGELLTTTAQTLGFVMWAVAVYMGEGKGKVERTIRAANEDYARRLPGYATPRLQTLTMRDAFRGLDEDLLTEREALDELGKWVEEWNNSPHPMQPGKSRYEVWADDPTPLIAVPEEQLRPAAVLMTTRPSYPYSKDGFRIRRDKVKYFYIHQELAGRVGEKFLLRHLPGDTDWVDAYTLDGDFVVRCWDHRLAEAATESKAISKRRREKYKALASLRSEAVEMRKLATTEVRGTAKRPNLVATAVSQTAVTGAEATELLHASLDLDPAGPTSPAGPAVPASPFITAAHGALALGTGSVAGSSADSTAPPRQPEVDDTAPGTAPDDASPVDTTPAGDAAVPSLDDLVADAINHANTEDDD